MKPKKILRLEIGAPTRILILLVGCGGTGSYAALHLAQFAYANKNQFDTRLIFIDPDTVEEKNIARQNFAPGEVGQPKAVTLARRYSFAYGLNITPIVGKFEPEILQKYKKEFDCDRDIDSLILIVGCVDNPSARLDIHRALKRSRGVIKDFHGRGIWWLDAGNDNSHGQILLGNNLQPQPQLSPLGFAFGLPLPSVQEPALIAPAPAEAVPEMTAESCAELTLAGVQARTINKMMACWLDVFIERLFVSRDLRMMAVHLDQRSGSAHSTPITDGQTIGLQAQAPEADEPPRGPWVCPECAGDLVEGRDILLAEIGEEDILFCPGCDWMISLDRFEELYVGNPHEELAYALNTL